MSLQSIDLFLFDSLWRTGFIGAKFGLPAGITALVVGMLPPLIACGADCLPGEPVSARQRLGLGLSGVYLARGQRA